MRPPSGRIPSRAYRHQHNGEAIPPQPVQCMTALGPRWFEIAGSGIRDRHGQVVGVRAIGRDIRERRAAEDERCRAEAALHDSEARYRGIIESTQSVFVSIRRNTDRQLAARPP